MPSFNICNYSACVYTYKCVWVCMQICMPKKRLSHIPNGACLINFLQFVHKHTYLHMWHICSYMLQGCSCLCAYYQSLGCLAAWLPMLSACHRTSPIASPYYLLTALFMTLMSIKWIISMRQVSPPSLDYALRTSMLEY